MPERIGWWTLHAETQTVVNRVSDQRIRFEGAVDDAGSLLHPPASGPARLRFSYQDTDVRYPVVVIARYETYGGSGFDHGDSDRLSLGWSIDHLASAAEWRRSCAAPTEIPSYGQWRRVDDALFDALSCWRSGEGPGPEPSRIDSWGGWFNGEWSPRLRRVGAGRAERSTPVESGLRPFVEPLGSPPLSWQFVDAQKAVSCTALAESEARSTRTATTLRAQFFYADEDVFFRRRNVRLGSAPAARKGEQVHAIAGQAFWDAKSPSTLLGSSVAKLNPCE